jgi:hypothetical protein
VVAAEAPFPVVLTVPINGRITALQALTLPNHSKFTTSLLFITTDQYQYAVVGYNPYPNNSNNNNNNHQHTGNNGGSLQTFCSGS